MYVVYGNVNSAEEDYSFLITALYHWEELYPVITPYLPSDPAEIRVKSKPKPKEEEKKEVAVAAGAQNEEAKDKAEADKQGQPKSIKDLILDKEKKALIEKALEDGVSNEPIGQKLLEQILSDEGNSNDIFDLINLQRQQQEMNRPGRGGRGGARGGGLFGNGRGGARGGASMN